MVAPCRRSTRVSGPAVVEAGSAEGGKPQEEPKKPEKARGAQPMPMTPQVMHLEGI